MDIYIKNVIAILLSVVTITGLIIWAIKELIKKVLQADTEKHKNKLQLEYQKFNKLQNEQFDTLKVIYSNLVRIDELLHEAFELVKDGKELDKKKIQNRFEPLMNLISDTERHFKQNAIFLNEKICLKINLTIKALIYCSTKSMYAILVRAEDIYDNHGTHLGIKDRDLENLTEIDKTDFYDVINKIEDVRKIELNELLQTLKLEFRNLFGVKTE